MKEKEIKTIIKECGYDEFTDVQRRLVDAARKVSLRSYAPYSKFHVGAAILMDNGEICVGSNQENAAYPSGICAERTAAYHASAVYPDVPMRKIAIAAWTRTGCPDSVEDAGCFQKAPISPCGACRQALLEYEARFGEIEVILYGADCCYILPSVASLLPFCFTEF